MISKADTIKQLLAAFSAESLKKELVSPVAFATGENKTAETTVKDMLSRESLAIGDNFNSAGAVNAISLAFAGSGLAKHAKQITDSISSKSASTGGIDYRVFGNTGATRDPLGIFAREGFVGEDGNNLAAYSMTYNAMVNRAGDPVTALFFPQHSIGANEPGVEITLRMTNLFKQFKRDSVKAPTPAETLTPVVKTIFDKHAWSGEQNRCYPIYTADRDNELVSDCKKDVNGIRMAPIKIGKTVDLIKLSLDGTVIGDHTDALSAEATKLSSILLKMVDSAANKTEKFEISVTDLAGSMFVPANGNNINTNDYVLNFGTEIVLPLSSFVWNGTTSEILSALGYSDYSVALSVSLAGKVSTSGNISVDVVGQNSITVARVIDANGQTITTGAAYTAITTAFSALAISVESYYPEAYLVNNNFRQLGQVLTTSAYRLFFGVPYRSGISVFGAIDGAGVGEYSDTLALASQVDVGSISVANSTISKLKDMVGKIKSWTKLDDPATTLGLLSCYYVDPAVEDITVSLQDVVSTLNSAGKVADIKAAITTIIRDTALNLMKDSGYTTALIALNGGQVNIRIIAAVGLNIGMYLCPDGVTNIAIGPNMTCEVATSYDPDMNDTLVMSFGTGAAFTGTEMDLMQFGFTFTAPAVAGKITTMINGSNQTAAHVVPRWLQTAWLPILGRVVISDMNQAHNKFPILTKTEVI